MASVAPGQVRIGISGWNYVPWRGVFYPPGLKHAEELGFASRVFPSIELNGSFYSLQRPTSYESWYRATPSDFVFAVKGGRYVTHMKRLRDARLGLANFFASGLLNLHEKLGPVLWQLPPRLQFEPETLREFLHSLPKDWRALQKLARDHGPRLLGRSVVSSSDANRPVRHAFEVRHESFVDERFMRLLREHGAAACVADTAQLYPVIERATADFVYVRLHGSQQLYVSGYTAEELSQWADKVRIWASRGLDVYVYFDNDVKVRAPFDALNLRRLLAGLPAIEPPALLERVSEEPRSGWPEWRRAARA